MSKLIVNHSFLLLLLLISVLNRALMADDFSRVTLAQDSSVAHHYFAQARAFTQTGQYDSSIVYFQKAAEVYKNLSTREKIIPFSERYLKCLNEIGNNLRNNGEYDQALEVLKQALNFGLTTLTHDHSEVANTINYLGAVYYYTGQFDPALHHFKNALNIRLELFGQKHVEVANSFNNIGEFYRIKGDYEQALEYYSRSLAIDLELWGENNLSIAGSYNNIGIIHYETGDYETAFEYYLKSLNIRRELLNPSHPLIAESYSNIGLVLIHQGKYEEGIEYCGKAVDLQLQELGENHPVIYKNYENIGVAYFYQAKYEQSLTYYQQALAIKLQILDELNPEIAASYHNLGMVYAHLDQFEPALNFYSQALSIHTAVFGENHVEVAKTYQSISELYFQSNAFDQALAFIQQALATLNPDYFPDSIYVNPCLEDIRFPNNTIISLALKANILSQINAVDSQPTKALETALSTYQLTVALIDQIRNQYQTEGAKLFLGAGTSALYEQAIQTALTLYQLTGADEYLAEAFRLVEKAKAMVLLSSLQDSHAKQFAGIPDSYLQQEKDLKIEIAFYETQLLKTHLKNQPEDLLQMKELEHKLFDLKRKYEHLIQIFETDYPQYYSLKHQIQVVSATKLQAALPPKTTLIEYFVGEQSIFIFLINKTGLDVIAVAKDSSFETLAESMNRAIKKLDSEGFIEVSHALYKILMTPIEDRLVQQEKLIIIPHSILYKIPFESLLFAVPTETGLQHFGTFPFLLRRFCVAYHYSATLYYNRFTRVKPIELAHTTVGDFVGFAPVFTFPSKNNETPSAAFPPTDRAASASANRGLVIDGQKFEALQYSETEVRQIIELFHSHHKTAQGFFYDNASESNFKNLAGGYKQVHIATHGIINEEKPRLSGIILAPPADSAVTEDGLLYAGETYNLNLNADLIVLSSCESGIGKLIRGEGLMALTRGFFYSGTSNIVVSLWKVSDKHTCQLMVAFYEYILAGENYASALRQAKLKLLQNPLTAFPRSWSSFILIGE